MPELNYEYDDAAAAASSRNGAQGPELVTLPTRPRRPIIRFKVGEPKRITMLSVRPKTIRMPHGGLEYQIWTKDGVAFVEAETIVKINRLQLKPREEFWILRKGGLLGGWDVYRLARVEAANSNPGCGPLKGSRRSIDRIQDNTNAAS